MKMKKSAVAPIAPPSVIENSMIPATWQEAFNMLAGRVMNVTRHQHDLIDRLSGEVRTAAEDAAGVAAANEKRRGDLESQVAGLTAALDVQDGAVKATAAKLADALASIKDAADGLAAVTAGHDATAVAVLALADLVEKTLAPLLDQHTITLADQSGRINQVDDAARERLDALEASEVKTSGRLDLLTDRARGVDTRMDRVDESAAAIGRQGIATASRVDDLRVTLEALGATVEDYAKTASSEDAALLASVDEVGDAVRAVEQRVMELQGVAGRHSVSIDDQGKAIDLVGERITDAVGTVDTLVKARAVDTEWVRAVEARAVAVELLAGTHTEALDQVDKEIDKANLWIADTVGLVEALKKAWTGNVERIDTIADNVAEARTLVGAVSREVDEGSARLSQVEEAVVGFVATAANIGREVAGAVAAVERIDQTVVANADQITDTIRRVTIALGELPAGMLIDHDGDLIRVNRNGEPVKLGKVVGETRDGKDAPVIVAAKFEGDRLIITLSDRTDITCTVPRDAVAPIAPADVEALDPTKLGYLSKDPNVRNVQIGDMINMRAAGKRYKEIAAKYQISERQAARLIKDGKPK